MTMVNRWAEFVLEIFLLPENVVLKNFIQSNLWYHRVIIF